MPLLFTWTSIGVDLWAPIAVIVSIIFALYFLCMFLQYREAAKSGHVRFLPYGRKF